MTINDMIVKAYNNLMASGSISDDVKSAATAVMHTVKIIRNDRLRTVAGRCRCYINRLAKTITNLRIEWNPRLFSRISEDEQFDIASHEFSHAVEFCSRLDSDHGYVWKSIHLACGGNAKRTHDYNTIGLKKKVKRICVIDIVTNKEHRITVNNWNRIQWEGRYKKIKTEIYQGKTLMASYAHA